MPVDLQDALREFADSHDAMFREFVAGWWEADAAALILAAWDARKVDDEETPA